MYVRSIESTDIQTKNKKFGRKKMVHVHKTSCFNMNSQPKKDVKVCELK